MRRALATFMTVVSAFALSAMPAAAARHSASGTAQITSLVFTGMRTAGGNTFFEGVESGVVSGTLTGTYVEHFEYVVHPGGNTSFRSMMTFTGAIAGCGSGTVPFALEGRGDGAFTEGTQTAVGGAENTLGVQADLRFLATLATGTIAYSGAYGCA
jgi:hypothetical protein